MTFDTSSGSWLCSGTVVSPNVVLTAAHCADGTYSYVVWTEHTGSSTVGVAVSAIVTAPGYDAIPDYLNDAALLVLSSPTSAAPIALATTEPAGGTPAAIYSWGDTTATGGSGLASTTCSTVIQSNADGAAYWGNWWTPLICARSTRTVSSRWAPVTQAARSSWTASRSGSMTATPARAPRRSSPASTVDGWIQAEIAANVRAEGHHADAPQDHQAPQASRQAPPRQEGPRHCPRGTLGQHVAGAPEHGTCALNRRIIESVISPGEAFWPPMPMIAMIGSPFFGSERHEPTRELGHTSRSARSSPAPERPPL